MGRVRILDRTGDTVLEVTPESEESVRQEFEKMMKAGNLAYKVGGNGKNEQTREFDPNAETVITPPLVGG